MYMYKRFMILEHFGIFVNLLGCQVASWQAAFSRRSAPELTTRSSSTASHQTCTPSHYTPTHPTPPCIPLPPRSTRPTATLLRSHRLCRKGLHHYHQHSPPHLDFRSARTYSLSVLLQYMSHSFLLIILNII